MSDGRSRVVQKTCPHTGLFFTSKDSVETSPGKQLILQQNAGPIKEANVGAPNFKMTMGYLLCQPTTLICQNAEPMQITTYSKVNGTQIAPNLINSILNYAEVVSGMNEEAKLPLDWVIGRIGEYTDDAILFTEAEPIDLPGPRILWCNTAFTKMTGYTLDDISGKTPRILQGSDTDKAALRKIRTALENWESVRVDLKNYRKDGSAFWVDLGIQPVADETGFFQYWIAIQREMPALLEQDQLLRRATLVTEETPVALGLLDSQSRLVFANEYFKQLIFPDELSPALPFPYEAWLKRGHAGRHEDAQEEQDWVARHLSGLFSDTCRIEQKVNGHWHEFRRIATAQGDHLIIGEDIEERIALQDHIRQITKLDAMGQLTSGVAHDFNNLLAVILGNAELAQWSEHTSAEMETFVEETVKAAQKGRSLTQSLLSFARKSHMSPVSTRVDHLVRDTAVMFGRTSARGLNIQVDSEADLPPIHVDPGLLQNAVLNLLINARDATTSGGTVTVSLRQDDETHLPDPAQDGRAVSSVSITVSDQGKGMRSEVLARAIEPFFTTKRVGSGLGLSMVHGFVQQSGGKLAIDTKENRGTAVSIHLPADVAPVETISEEPEATMRLDGRSILVVEDELAVRRLLVRILEREGATVMEAKDGDTALGQKTLWPNVDLLLTDIVMPGRVQGDDLARRFSEVYPNKPVLLVSGNPEMAATVPRNLTGTQFLTKPVERSVLLGRVAHLLRNVSND